MFSALHKIYPLLITVLLLLSTSLGQAQNVGIGTTTPDSTAILELLADDMGFLPPRLSTPERDSINAPATGLVIYNTTDSALQVYNGSCWLFSYQQDCDDCFFSVSPSSIADTIDRVITDSVQIQLNITQTAGNPQNIAFNIASSLPQGMTYSIVNNPQFSSGTVTVTFYVTPFTPDGTFPIVIQTLCGSQTDNFIYSLTILPCYAVSVINTMDNYDLATDVYNTHPNAPTNAPICVVCEVQAGVTVSSTTTADPAFDTGNLPAGSVAAIVNNGNIIGKGGDGGTAFDPTANPPLTGEGFDGGDAINLTVNTTILNNFNIYGGGGGGNAMAFQVGIQLGPVFLGALIGSGGGGGAGGSLGGNTPNVIGLTFYSPGTDGTAGQFGVPGVGGLLNYPINLTLGPVDIDINPNALGGNGGPYGFPGTVGSFNLTLSASVIVNVPFVGPVPIPIVQNLNIPIPIPPPPAGDAGHAIKRNGNTTNIPDNTYNTSFLKGEVGN